ncbi:PREDICTED: translation initiation factor IF-2-like [Chinchilla lanigera]|uniref:translation initiation factor IF-2-like n=1 Tax=Chinchilla lanigera TaxID=34839 RepID=UPI00038EB44B|nr:PREDICTED: translation initiation factor IF-2-like [Chinchilla lanigera]
MTGRQPPIRQQGTCSKCTAPGYAPVSREAGRRRQGSGQSGPHRLAASVEKQAPRCNTFTVAHSATLRSHTRRPRAAGRPRSQARSLGPPQPRAPGQEVLPRPRSAGRVNRTPTSAIPKAGARGPGRGRKTLSSRVSAPYTGDGQPAHPAPGVQEPAALPPPLAGVGVLPALRRGRAAALTELSPQGHSERRTKGPVPRRIGTRLPGKPALDGWPRPPSPLSSGGCGLRPPGRKARGPRKQPGQRPLQGGPGPAPDCAGGAEGRTPPVTQASQAWGFHHPRALKMQLGPPQRPQDTLILNFLLRKGPSVTSVHVPIPGLRVLTAEP